MKTESGDKTPQSTADRQRAFRERKKQASMAEVRGIFATPENSEKIKKYAAKLKT